MQIWVCAQLKDTELKIGREGTSDSWNWCPLNLCPFLKKNFRGKKNPGKILVSITFHFPLPGWEPDVLWYRKVCPIGIFGCINFSNYWKFYVRRFTGKYDPNFLRHQGLLWGWRRTVNVSKHLVFFLRCVPIQMGPICFCNSDCYTRNNAIEESVKSPPYKKPWGTRKIKSGKE